jgi:radical SAM superfamily enzyme YgiQ (UPF0313 family)
MKSVLLIDIETKPVKQTEHYYAEIFTEPLGLLYLESFLKSNSIDINILKYPLKDSDWDIIEKHDVIGLSFLTYAWNTAKSLAKLIKEKYPHKLIVAGREHATALPDLVLETSFFDAVIFGEGEFALLELAKGKCFNEIEGIIYKDDKGIIFKRPKSKIVTSSDVFLTNRRPEWMINMFQESMPISNRMAGIMMSRGCHFDCDFCTARNMWGKFRSLSVDIAIGEILNCLNNFGITYFAFHDLMFNSSKEKVYQLCDEILRRKLAINIFSMMSVNSQTLDFRILRKAGFTEIGVGIEIPSDKRESIGKQFSFNKTIEFIKGISDAGIFVRGYVLIGWPWDDNKDELINSYTLALSKLAINNLRLAFITPFPGTRLFENYKNFIDVDLTRDGFDYFTTMHPILEFNLKSEALIESRYQILNNFYRSDEYQKLLLKQSAFKPISNMNEYYYNYIKDNLSYA